MIVKGTINNSKTNGAVVANHVKVRSGSENLESNFHIWFQQFKNGEKLINQFTAKLASIGSAKQVHFLFKAKHLDKGFSIILTENSS